MNAINPTLNTRWSRVIRGGGWSGSERIARASFRDDGGPPFSRVGFRLVKNK
jgi:formylglycine-generating enzyme required for sulfatase activity